MLRMSPAKPPPLQRRTPSCTVSKAPDDDNSSNVIPISQKRFYTQNTALATSTRKKTTCSPEVSDREVVSVATLLRDDDSEQRQEVGKPEIDPAIEEKVYIGLNQVKEDWKQQGQLIQNLQKEVGSMRAEVAKTTSLPLEVRKVGNDVSGLVQNVNTFGADFIDLRANMLGVTEHVQATKADMSSMEKSCHSIKRDTSMIKSSTENHEVSLPGPIDPTSNNSGANKIVKTGHSGT